MFENLILEKKNLQPVIIHEEKTKHLFGLVTIRYLLEDRRPDLFYGDGEDKSSKYKHQIRVCIFGKSIFSAVLRSAGTGFVGTKPLFQKEQTSFKEITPIIK